MVNFKVGRTRRSLFVLLVQSNPLATLFIRRMIPVRGDVRVVSEYENLLPLATLSAHLLFVVDGAALRTPLHRYLKYLRQWLPRADVILLGHDPSGADLCRWLFFGIQGFVSYDEIETQFVPAFNAIVEGKLWIPQKLLDRFMRHSTMRPSASAHPLYLFTSRERLVLQLLQGGLSNKEIAFQLKLSQSTVKFHLRNIFSKLGLHDRSSVVKLVNSTQLKSIVESRTGPNIGG